MTERNSLLSRSKTRLVTAAASVAIAAAIGFGAVTAGTDAVRAEPVRVETQNAAPGFGDVVERVSPAVVSVRVQSRERPVAFDGNQQIPGFEDLPQDHPMRRFFREFGGQDGPRFERRGERRGQRGDGGPLRPTGQGSGFFVSADGYLVTNNHVVDGGETFSVVMDDGTELDAKLVGRDPRTDLAVLKVEESREFTYVSFADDSKVRVGDWVVAVGNPFGLGGSVTAGIVSARGRDIGAGPYDDFLQIDAAVNRGNSGGPAFNQNGEVVGVNTAIFSPSGGNVGIAFAIPATVAKDVVAKLMTGDPIQRGWLGVQIQPVTPEIAESIGLDNARGAIVASAQEDSPALKAGIQNGDVITAVDGEAVNSPRELARVIGSDQPGKVVKVDVWRDGSSETVDVTLGELPSEETASLVPGDDGNSQEEDQGNSLADYGLTVTPSDDGQGVVVTEVDPESDAASRGIQSGDVILEVNAKAVKSARDVERAVTEAASAGRKQVLVQVLRDDANRFLALPINAG